jgi:hypothetical protein
VSSAIILSQRLINQQLVGTKFRQPEDIVVWMGALQAQEYAMAKWAIGLRLGDTKDEIIERAFNEGHFLRTHVLRPTWHFVAPADIRWMLKLTAPRIRRAMAYMDRQLEIDRGVIIKSQKVFTKALQGGHPLRRRDLQTALTRARIAASGPRLAHLLIHAELDQLICSGPRRQRNFTYMLLDERVPPAAALDGDAALAELSRRYFRSRGPASVQDFSWWSGLSVREARRGVDLLGTELAIEVINGRELVRSSKTAPRPRNIRFTCLLPDYDEYGIAYKDRTALFEVADLTRQIAYNRMIIIDGRIAGSWKRSEEKTDVVVEAVLFRPLTGPRQQALTKAGERFGKFLQRPVRLVSTLA